MMVLSVRKWFRRAIFMLILVLCTTIMYNGCRILGEWLRPVDPYRVPQGAALKVFSNERAMDEERTFSQRLRFFYWYGE